MGLRENRFYQHSKAGIALAAQSISNTTVNGAAIVEPWAIGRQLVLTLVGGAIAAGGTNVCTIQGLKRSDGTTWEALKQKDGTTDLTFTSTKINDTQQLENGIVRGCIPLDRVKAGTYKSIRVSFAVTGAFATLVGASYEIVDLFELDQAATDDLFGKLHA